MKNTLHLRLLCFVAFIVLKVSSVNAAVAVTGVSLNQATASII